MSAQLWSQQNFNIKCYCKHKYGYQLFPLDYGVLLTDVTLFHLISLKTIPVNIPVEDKQQWTTMVNSHFQEHATICDQMSIVNDKELPIPAVSPMSFLSCINIEVDLLTNLGCFLSSWLQHTLAMIDEVSLMKS